MLITCRVQTTQEHDMRNAYTNNACKSVILRKLDAFLFINFNNCISVQTYEPFSPTINDSITPRHDFVTLSVEKFTPTRHNIFFSLSLCDFSHRISSDGGYIHIR